MAADARQRADAGSRRHRGNPFALHLSGLRKAAAYAGRVEEGGARPACSKRWRRNSVFPHKVQGYSIVTLSLKPVGGPPGDATADQMDAIADLADRYSFGEIRVGHEQNLCLPHVAKRDLPALWKALDKIGVATPNVNLVTDIIACPGLDYCSLANARSIPIAQELTRRFANHDTAEPDRPAAHQHFRLHQRLRPSPCRPHRHSRRREERRGILPDHDRRPRRRERPDGYADRPRGALCAKSPT